MSNISPLRNNIQVEETEFLAAVSESTMQKIGGSVNFINQYQKYDKVWCVNGAYSTLSIPFLGIDNLIYLPDNATITNAFMFCRKAGTSGTTTLDIKYATTPGGTFTSIFSTKPSIGYSAGDFSWCYTGSAFANTTAPVLGTANLNANSVLRMDITTAQSGGIGCGIVLFMQPR